MVFHHTPSRNCGRGGPGNRRISSLSSDHVSPQNQSQRQGQNQGSERSGTLMGPPPPPQLQQGQHPFAAQFGQIPALPPPGQGLIGPVYFHQNHPNHPPFQQSSYHSLHQNQNQPQNRSPTHSHRSQDFPSPHHRQRHNSLHHQRQNSVHHHQPYRRITPPTPTARQTTHAHPIPSPASSSAQQVPEIIDRYSLQTAVRLDPDVAFSRINSVRAERDLLAAENQRLGQLLEMSRRDYANALRVAEKMGDVWKEKQVLFWKYVERVKKEREGDLVDGEWVGDREGEEEMSAGEVQRLWGVKLRKDFPASTPVDEDGEMSPRGRSSEVALRDFRIGRAGAQGNDDDNELIGLEEGSVMSGGEPLSDEARLLLANARLDPHARPFVPSPTRSSTRDNDSTRNTPNPQPKVLPAIPLSFSEILKRQPPPVASQTPPPSEQRKTTNSEKRGNSTPASSKTKSQASNQESTTRGGKKGNKSSRGGAKTLNPPSRSTGNATENKNEIYYPRPRKNNKRGSKSPTKLATIANPSPSEGGEKVPRQTIDPITRKVSPEVVRVANLPPYPHELAILALKAQNEARANAEKAAADAEVLKANEVAEKERQAIRNPTPTFLSRAKMNATLTTIGEPFGSVCPFSLLQNDGCIVKGCSLLHVCERYNGLLSAGGEEVEYPLLGSPLLGSPLRGESSQGCKDLEGHLVKTGGICAAGKIHIFRSCGKEIEGEECPYWASPSSSPPPGKQDDSIPPTEDCGGAHSHPIQDTTSMAPEEVFTTEDKEEHFRRFFHERDGTSRGLWTARVKNAGLRSTHACGLWGVNIAFGISGEVEDDMERRDKIEWKGKERSVVAGVYEDGPWKARSVSRSRSVADETPWRGTSRRRSSRAGSVIEEREWSAKGKGKGLGTPKSKDRFGEGEEDFPKGLKWEERKGMTKEDWLAKDEWKK